MRRSQTAFHPPGRNRLDQIGLSPELGYTFVADAYTQVGVFRLLERPLLVDPRSRDLSTVITSLIDDAVVEEHHSQVLSILSAERTFESLRQMVKLLPARRGMVYDVDSVGRRASRRVAKAFRFFESHGSGDFARVLDVGCARTENGPPCLERGVSRYVGLDLSCRHFPLERPERYELIQGSAQEIPLATDTVDLAFSFNVFEHLPSPDDALREILRVLRPGGVFYTHFGPPFNFATGPHLNKQIGLLYFQHLYSEEIVARLTGRTDAYHTVNRKSLAYYRDIFFSELGFRLSYYREQVNDSGFWLLKSLPELRNSLPVEELGVCAVLAAVVKC